MSKKRLFSEIVKDVKDDRKIKKPHVENVTLVNERHEQLKDALPEEFQPQFRDYMLIGDLVAIMILHSKYLISKTKSPRPVLYQNFCHSAWSVGDILNELKSKKNVYPVAKTVILSVGYNDYCWSQDNSSRSLSAVLLAEGVDKIIQKLRKRGCEDIILTNIPPAAAKHSSITHWKYLQTINDEILRLSEKYDFVGHCNIFKLFSTPKNYFAKNKNYVTFEEINYKVDRLLYSEERRDLVSFSDLGKTVLGKHIARSIDHRIEFLRQRRINKVIGSFEISDSDDEEIVEVKIPKQEIIELIDDEEEDDDDVGHNLDCQCEMCQKDMEF